MPIHIGRQAGRNVATCGNDANAKAVLGNLVELAHRRDRTRPAVETGEAEALCAAPRQAYTRQLLAATPLPGVA